MRTAWREKVLAEQRGYRNVGGTTTRRPEPEPEVQRVVIRSLALMDAYLRTQVGSDEALLALENMNSKGL